MLPPKSKSTALAGFVVAIGYVLLSLSATAMGEISDAHPIDYTLTGRFPKDALGFPNASFYLSFVAWQNNEAYGSDTGDDAEYVKAFFGGDTLIINGMNYSEPESPLLGITGHSQVMIQIQTGLQGSKDFLDFYIDSSHFNLFSSQNETSPGNWDVTLATFPPLSVTGVLDNPMSKDVFPMVFSATPVPEPGTICLIGAGLLGICRFSRRAKGVLFPSI